MPRVAVPLAAAAVVLLLLIARSPAHAFQQNVYLSLPWEGGATWRYSTGPHGPSGIPEALDLQPPDAAGKPCELFTSSFWVVASAPGTVIDVPNAIEIDHGNGFHTGYYHLQDKQVHSGHVEAGARLGKPGCCPDGPQGNCLSSAPHLHFYTSYNGARQDIHGLNIGGWTVDDDGCLARGDRRACPGSALVSEAPAAAGVQPLDIDVALVLHAAPGPLRTQAVASYLAGVGPKERVAVIESAKQPRVLSPLGDADRDGRPSADIARSSSAPPSSTTSSAWWCSRW